MIDCSAHRRASRGGQLLIARCQVMIEARRWDQFGEFANRPQLLLHFHDLRRRDLQGQVAVRKFRLLELQVRGKQQEPPGKPCC